MILIKFALVHVNILPNNFSQITMGKLATKFMRKHSKNASKSYLKAKQSELSTFK